MRAAVRPISAVQVAEALSDRGATHVLGIPDNGSATLFDHLAFHPSISLLSVTREAEAFAIAAGLWVGGARPVVAIQCTGLLESGDSIRGTVIRMGVPLLCLVGYRGYGKMVSADLEPPRLPHDPSTLRRADVDSAALFTEPTLTAWGIPHRRLDPHGGVGQIHEAWQRAEALEGPVALLLTRPLA